MPKRKKQKKGINLLLVMLTVFLGTVTLISSSSIKKSSVNQTKASEDLNILKSWEFNEASTEGWIGHDADLTLSNGFLIVVPRLKQTPIDDNKYFIAENNPYIEYTGDKPIILPSGRKVLTLRLNAEYNTSSTVISNTLDDNFIANGNMNPQEERIPKCIEIPKGLCDAYPDFCELLKQIPQLCSPTPTPFQEGISVKLQGVVKTGKDSGSLICANGLYLVNDSDKYLLHEKNKENLYTDTKYLGANVQIEGRLIKSQYTCEAMSCSCEGSKLIIETIKLIDGNRKIIPVQIVLNMDKPGRETLPKTFNVFIDGKQRNYNIIMENDNPVSLKQIRIRFLGSSPNIKYSIDRIFIQEGINAVKITVTPKMPEKTLTVNGIIRKALEIDRKNCPEGLYLEPIYNNLNSQVEEDLYREDETKRKILPKDPQNPIPAINNKNTFLLYKNNTLYYDPQYVGKRVIVTGIQKKPSVECKKESSCACENSLNILKISEYQTFPPYFKCPDSEYIDCMPVVKEENLWKCKNDYLTWAKENCPNFKGPTY